jgi:hypothetical protein
VIPAAVRADGGDAGAKRPVRVQSAAKPPQFSMGKSLPGFGPIGPGWSPSKSSP